MSAQSTLPPASVTHDRRTGVGNRNRIIANLLTAAGLLAGILLSSHQAMAAGAVCTTDLVISDADLSLTGGQNSDVDLANKVVKISADPTGAGNQDSVAELGFRFTAGASLQAQIQMGGIFAVGRLRGSSNIGFGSILVDAIIRDLTTDDELARTTVINISENGDVAETVIQPVNTLPTTAPVTFDVDLIEGRDYAALIRVEVEAQGFFGFSRFDGPNAIDGVHVGQVAITLDLEDDDGDGLPNLWETNGIDTDCDPSNGIDLDLAAMGANPNHKDLFIEVDWMPGAEPTQATMRALRDAFAAAPVEVAGVENPDGLRGITLRIDAGDLIDPAGAEDDATPNTCGDGLDNDSDGLVDSQDPNCLVGDLPFSSLAGGANLGDGQAIPITNISNLGGDSDDDGVPEFYEARQDNFDSALRGQAMRYAISALRVGSLAGEAELGGNDLVIFQLNEMPGCAPATGFPIGANAGVWMHELGHTFGFTHDGGTQGNRNNTPNYVSVVNYLHAFGIVQNQNQTSQDFDLDGTPDCRIIDYSPPRLPVGRGIAPLPELDEDGGLDETVRLDPTDSANQFAFFQPAAGQYVQWPLNQNPDYDGDGATDGTGLSLNLNNDVDASDDPRLQILIGASDWDEMLLDLRAFDDSDEGPVSNLGQIEIDDGIAMLARYREQLSTRLDLAKEEISDFFVAGQEITFRLSVTNNGPNPAKGIVLRDRLPAELLILEHPSGCEVAAPREVRCEVAELAVDDRRDFNIRTRLRADLDCRGRQVTSLANRADIIGFDGYQSGGVSQVVNEFEVLCIRYEYAAKVTCGSLDGTADAPLGSGHYATIVNIHNPNDEEVKLFKKLALTIPPREQAAGKVIPLAIDALGYDEALKADCAAIRKDLGSRVQADFFEGFVVVQSPRQLDVTTVYSVTTPQTTIHTEIVPERDRHDLDRHPPEDEPRRKPDLTPIDYACVPPPPGTGNRPVAVRITTRNIGQGPSGETAVRVTFARGRMPVDAPLSSLAAAQSAETEHTIPRNCPADCRFVAEVDFGEVVGESDENNNILEGACLPLPG